MALEVPQRIHERLVAVIDDLRNAVGQEAARAFLVSLTNVEPVQWEPEAASCDESWMEFINEDLMNDICHPSQTTPHRLPPKLKIYPSERYVHRLKLTRPVQHRRPTLQLLSLQTKGLPQDFARTVENQIHIKREGGPMRYWKRLYKACHAVIFWIASKPIRRP